MKGKTKSPPQVSLSEITWSWIGAFLGIAAVALINDYLLEEQDLLLTIGSFGASAVLIYGAVKSPLAQPRNLLGGHVLSALIGVAAYKMFQPHLWLAASVAVATAIAVMHATKTLHPPGGCHGLNCRHRQPEDSQSGLPLRSDTCGPWRSRYVGCCAPG